MDVALIVAVAENRVIGRQNALPWHISADLKNFRRITMGKPVVMGRRTFDSIGRPLPGRPNIVVTRDPGYAADGVHVADGMDAALSLARELGAEAGAAEIMVIGGGQVYAAALDRARRLYLTLVHETVEGDAWFPEFDPADWQEISRDRQAPENGDGPAFSFVVLERTPPGARNSDPDETNTAPQFAAS